MRGVTYRRGREAEIQAMSRQVSASYKAAYRGLMRQDYLDSLTPGSWEPVLRAGFARGDVCVVALEGDTVVGSAVFGRHEKDPAGRTAELFAIYVLPAYLGKGVGQGLYTHAEQSMQQQGFTGCVLEVLADNARARRFYIRNGFEKTGAFAVEENGMTLQCETFEKKW